MKKDVLIKIINEEISEYDYLDNDSYSKKQEDIDIINNEELQHQFICDFLLNKKNIKINPVNFKINGDWEKDDNKSKLNYDYIVDIEYKYDSLKNPVKFTINFDGSNGIDFNSNQKDAKWTDTNVSLSNENGSVDFTAFEKAPFKIQNLFIREFVENIIDNKSFNNNYVEKDNIKNTPYY